MVETVRRAILEHGLIARGEGVVAALSGGADSTALMLVLKVLSGEMGFRLTAAHFNHGIRGESARNDEGFVRKLCAEHDIRLFCGTGDVPGYASAHGLSVETAGRLLRYKFLEEVRKGCGADVTATAHHLDDNAESVLLHLIRGSGLKGLCGMDYRSGALIRPLLGVRRSEIEAFLSERGTAYCTDETNLIAEGSRNIIRLKVLPLLEKELNPQVIPAIARCAALLREDESYLSEAAKSALADAGTRRGYDRIKLSALPRPILTRALRLALIRAGAPVDIEKQHIESVIGLLAARSGASLALPHAKARISFESIVFSPAAEQNARRRDEKSCGRTEIPCIQGEEIRGQSENACRQKGNIRGQGEKPGASEASGVLLCTGPADMRKIRLPQGSLETAMLSPPVGIIHSGDIALTDADKLQFPLTVRFRRPGDTFKPANSVGTKKLKDYFIEKKADAAERDGIPLVVSGGKIIFIAGFGISDEVKLTAGTSRVLRIIFRRNGSGSP